MEPLEGRRALSMSQGTFRWYSSETGYGLISPDDGGRNLFVHSTDIASDSALEALSKGDTVTYEAHQSRHGMQAKNICALQRCYSWRDDSLERHEGKESRHEYYTRLDGDEGPRL
jgi:CspA family cold shock protein